MRSVYAKVPAVVRTLLGLIFFVFGLNGFLHFLPQPPISGPAGEYLGALVGTGYMIPLIKGTEVTAGLLLLTGQFVPLALTLLAPVIVNIAAFHFLLAPGNYAIVFIVLLSELYLAWAYRDAFRPMLAARAKPAPVSAGESRRTAGAVA